MAAYEHAGDPTGWGFGIDCEVRTVFEKDCDRDLCFQTSQRGPDTEMCSFAEGEMCSGIDSVEVHHLWFGERLGVAVRRTPQQYEMTAGGQCHATECRVRVDMSVMSAKG